MLYKDVLSGIAIFLTLVAFFPYIRSILAGTTKPHVFSWVIWSLTTSVVFFAQLQAGAGVGAWPTAVSGCVTLLIAFLAYLKRGDISITSSDRVLFIAGLSSLPFWYITSDPLWAVIILTGVDVLGFGPTFRKTFAAPFSESIMFYGISATRNIIVILALEAYSLTTVLFPAVIATECVVLIGMMLLRRKKEM